MANNFFDNFGQRKEIFDGYLENYFAQLKLPKSEAVHDLKKAMEYSGLQGGKRFRPLLCILTCEAFAVNPNQVLPLAAAVEMVHTYSLIHDDLPCMDNDDTRRGNPTNHKVFGESTALLAGDALLAEAFTHLAKSYDVDPQMGLQLVRLLSEAAGIIGMVGGQAIDLRSKKAVLRVQDLNFMHSMKTGALIRVCVEGTAVACGLPRHKVELAREFGAHLGMAFQLKDDLLDSTHEKIEAGSFPSVIGMDETHEYLSDVTDNAVEVLAEIGIKQGPLLDLVKFNQSREQ